ncbi:MAG: hypothetical protein LBT36_00775 [Oscillospiraceae bacterium]|jgi:hypothetical protein|nr:hypothetical protein [Oscillospiraceae bacterium]
MSQKNVESSDVMTDFQFKSISRRVLPMPESCKSVDVAIAKLRKLLEKDKED